MGPGCKPSVYAEAYVSDFFFYFGIFNQYLRNVPCQFFLKNLTIFSRVNPVDATYEEVTPVYMA
jgi:hypothetical protein